MATQVYDRCSASHGPGWCRGGKASLDFVSTCLVDLCGGAIEEDRGGVVGEEERGGDSGLVLGDVHTVKRQRQAAEAQRRVVHLRHSGGQRWFNHVVQHFSPLDTQDSLIRPPAPAVDQTANY